MIATLLTRADAALYQSPLAGKFISTRSFSTRVAVKTNEYDVVIVGAGVIGSSTALHLSKKLASKKTPTRILVVDRRSEIAAEQSSKSWGFVRVQGRDYREIPLMLEARDFWKNLGAEVQWQQTGHIALYDRADAQKAGRVRNWAEYAIQHFGVKYEILNEGTTRQETQDARDELHKLLPTLRNPGQYGACFTPEDGNIDPRLGTEALAKRAQSGGASSSCSVEFRLNTEVQGVSQDHNARISLKLGTTPTATERITAKSLVIATAGWAPEFLRANKLPTYPSLRLHASAGELMMKNTDNLKSETDHPTVWYHGLSFRKHKHIASSPSQNKSAASSSFTFTFADGGAAEEHDFGLESVLYGWRFLPHLKDFYSQTNLKFRPESFPSPRIDKCPDANEKRLEKAVAKYRNMFGVLHGSTSGAQTPPVIEMSKSWAGWIDITPDMIPVIDYVPTKEDYRKNTTSNIVISSGYSGHGLGLAPAAGRLTADLVVASLMPTGTPDEMESLNVEKVKEEAYPFRFSRFQEQWFHSIQSLV
ncbi:unnamed protein product [Amoebophrya sp. A120]|nr:unnamed protein product [Amoebophrya sp. A120]|eukprot:GSA120T00004208001.1